MRDFKILNQHLIIDDDVSAIKCANILIWKLQELESYANSGRSMGHLFKQLRDIIFCIYYKTDKQYTNFLHNVVNYVLLQIFKYED